MNKISDCALVLGLALITSAPVYAQTTSTDSVRVCSSFERDLYATNSSGEIWYVASDSMYPLLTAGDVVAVDKNANFSDITIGDIIVFEEPVPDTDEADAVISRVNEILNDPRDDIVILTKGDANSGSIPGIDFPVYENNFIGIVSCFLEEGQFKR
jgi:signal peptidase I